MIDVPQGEFRWSPHPAVIRTDGIGPCVGIALAWGTAGGILHSADVATDERDVVTPFFGCAKAAIPLAARGSVRPIICGAALDVFYGDENDAVLHAELRRTRENVQQLVRDHGFGSPIVLWNEPGRSQSLIADLRRGEIIIEVDGRRVHAWAVAAVD